MKMLFVFGMVFVLGAQPILLMGGLVGVTLLYSLYTYMEVGSFWFGYMYMLVMLSGVLVLFSYVLSLIPNSEMEYSNFFLVMGSMGMLFLYKNEVFLYLNMCNYSLNMWLYLFKLFTLFLVFFLLIMMIVVVWISMADEGSLREGLLCAWVKG